MDTTTRETCIEGALRAGKTTLCLWRELNSALAHPGIAILLARWTDTGVHGQLLPLWRAICAQVGLRLDWHATEEYDTLPNGSRAYVRGLRAQEQTLRYSKIRGLTVARVCIDQAEEIPHDVYLEAAGRLSQPGHPHQITISPQSVAEDHWIAREFPEDDRFRPHRRLIQLSVYDNSHNLSPEVIPALERLYPPEHPQHRTLVLGRRGLNVTGVPVYAGAFTRALHCHPVAFDPRLPLEVGIDFGKHHPAAVFRQVSSLGQVRYLGGVLGQDLYLDDFLTVMAGYQAQWFPGATEVRECCDPAGTSDTSHGTHGALAILHRRGVHPRWVGGSNSPMLRLAAIERMAAQMRRRAADGEEAFAVASDERWVRVSSQATVADHFLRDAFEAGYVWDPHMVSVSNKPVRKPKKDGWYEHGMNCAEYLELNFGGMPTRRAGGGKRERYRPVSAWG